MLMDTGGIEQRNGRWVAVPGAAAIDVPPTLVGLISARLDRVSPDVKRVLQRGSLAGRIFSVTTLAVLGDGEVPDQQVLREAVRRDLLVEADERAIGDGRVYRFKHVLIRDVAYTTLPKAERSRLHDRYGRWLEESLGERSAEVLEIVAHHAEQAHAFAHELGAADADALGQRAFGLLFRAGHAAFERDDLPAAESLYGRAVAIGQTASVPTAERVEAGGWVAIYQYWREPTAEHVEQLERLARETRADGPSRILAALFLTSAWHVGNNTDRTSDAAELNANALDVARQANDARYIAASLIQRGVFRYWTGDLAASKAALVEALAQIDAQSAERERPTCLHWLWVSALQQGEFSEAARHHDAAVRSLEARRSQIGRIFAGSQRGQFATRVGDYETAVRVLRDARAIALELGRDRDLFVSWHLGWALCASGDNAAALEPLARTIEILERRKQFGQLSMVQAMAAIAHARSGDAQAARALVEAARRTALGWDWIALVWNERADAEVCEAEGHPERSPALFQKALALIPPAFQDEATEVGIAFAEFLIRQRRPAEARPLLDAARAFYRDPAAFRLRAEAERLLRQCEQVRT